METKPADKGKGFSAQGSLLDKGFKDSINQEQLHSSLGDYQFPEDEDRQFFYPGKQS